jgi:sulfotransferase family protein
MSEEKPKVVYILGSGRSGSTILGLALGNCASIFCAGELHLWLGKAGRSPLRGAERERFWSEVREAVEIPSELPRDAGRSLEKSSAVFRVGDRRARRRLRGPYRRVTEDLYRAIARAARATHIVDTSHFPRRARELQALDAIELYLLFVVRDPRNVVASYSRDNVDFPRFTTITTNAYLWLTHMLSLFVFLRHPRDRRLLVRYEAFVSDPEAVLQRILDCIGSAAALPDLAALDTGVAFQGNGLLRADVVALKRRVEESPGGSRITALLQLPWKAIVSRLRPVATARGDSR